MTSDGTVLANFTAPELANFLAAQAVAAATRFLDGRSDADALAAAAQRVFAQLELIGVDDPRCNAIVDPTRMLIVAMVHAAISPNTERAGRWAAVMAAFVPLLRLESTELAASGAQRQ